MSAPTETALRARLHRLGVRTWGFKAQVQDPRRDVLENKLRALESESYDYNCRTFRTNGEIAAARVRIAALCTEVEKLKKELGEE